MNVSVAYTWQTDECSKRDHNPMLPSNIRGLIIGLKNNSTLKFTATTTLARL